MIAFASRKFNHLCVFRDALALAFLAIVFLVGLLLVDFALLMLLARFPGGFFIVPFSINAMVLSSRIAAVAMFLVVEPRFLAAEIALRVLGPVLLPATPFFGALAMTFS